MKEEIEKLQSDIAELIIAFEANNSMVVSDLRIANRISVLDTTPSKLIVSLKISTHED